VNDGILSMPEFQYRSSEAIAKSDLDWICPPRTPAHYRAKKLGLVETEQTPAMRLGSMVHRAILEPDTIKDAWVVKPAGMNFATKEGKEWKASQTLPIISEDEDVALRGMMDSVWSNPNAKRIISGSDVERSAFATDSDGILRKARIDILPKTGNIVADLKTTASADPQEMEKSIAKYRYNVQAAYYLDILKLLGIERTQFLIIAVEKEPPFASAVYALDPDAIEWGRKQYRRDLALVRHCEAENHFPAWGNDIVHIGLPAWMTKQLEGVL